MAVRHTVTSHRAIERALEVRLPARNRAKRLARTHACGEAVRVVVVSDWIKDEPAQRVQVCNASDPDDRIRDVACHRVFGFCVTTLRTR